MYRDYEQYMKLFLNNIWKLCDIKDLSIGELEDRIKVSKGYFARLRRNVQNSTDDKRVFPDMNLLTRICSEFNLSLDMLFYADLGIDDKNKLIHKFLMKIKKDLDNDNVKIHDLDLMVIAACDNERPLRLKDNSYDERDIKKILVNNCVEIKLANNLHVRIYNIDMQEETEQYSRVCYELAVRTEDAKEFTDIYVCYDDCIGESEEEDTYKGIVDGLLKTVYLEILHRRNMLGEKEEISSDIINSINEYLIMNEN